MLALMLISFILFLFLGMPVYVAMGISGALAILGIGNIPALLIPQKIILSLNSFPLLAVPLFVLTGELMNRGGITHRIVNFSKCLIGFLAGGLAHVNILASIFMAGFSGSATADAVAIGGIMIPAMVKDGYSPGFSAGVTAASSCIGPIIPPSIIMVLYGAITGLSIGKMFIGGLIPGLTIGLSQMIIVGIYAKKENWPRGKRVGFKRTLKAFYEAIWALFAPIIIIGGFLTGVITATEAGVIAVVYALFIGLFVYKEIKFKEIKSILVKAAVNTSIPVVIISFASIFGWVLARQNFASSTINYISGITSNPNLAILVIIGVLLLIGMFVEATAALLIFTPILFPLGCYFGFDSIHFALIILITILMGTITPPVGLQLYIACSIAKISINKVVILPFILIMILVIIIITYIPGFVLWLPALIFK